MTKSGYFPLIAPAAVSGVSKAPPSSVSRTRRKSKRNKKVPPRPSGPGGGTRAVCSKNRNPPYGPNRPLWYWRGSRYHKIPPSRPALSERLVSELLMGGFPCKGCGLGFWVLKSVPFGLLAAASCQLPVGTVLLTTHYPLATSYWALSH
jgi:hypothetical protein